MTTDPGAARAAAGDGGAAPGDDGAAPGDDGAAPGDDVARSELEIAKLIHRYGYLLDAADFEGIAALLAHSTFGSDKLGRDAFRGHDEILQQFERTSIPEGTRQTKQLYTNVIVDVDGDRARALSNFLVLQATDTMPLQPIVCGHFEDDFERVDRTWRFARRYIVVELVGDLSQRLYQGTQPYR